MLPSLKEHSGSQQQCQRNDLPVGLGHKGSEKVNPPDHSSMS